MEKIISKLEAWGKSRPVFGDRPAERAFWAILDEFRAKPSDFKPEDLMQIWNELRDPRLHKCVAMTAGRRKHTSQRIKEYPDREIWRRFITTINNNDWMLGENPRVGHPNWKATFDWFIKPLSVVKFLEGRYDNSTRPPQNKREEYGDEIDRRSEDMKNHYGR